MRGSSASPTPFSHSFQADSAIYLVESHGRELRSVLRGSLSLRSPRGVWPVELRRDQAFKLYGLWQPTFFHGNGWLHKIAGGWSLSGIWNVHSGFPGTPSTTPTPCITRAAATANFGPQRCAGSADKHQQQYIHAGRSTQITEVTGPLFSPPRATWKGPFPGFSPAPVPGIHRNTLNSPGYNDVDLTLEQSFRPAEYKGLGERAQLLVRADVYNFFNKTNINSLTIDGNLGSVAPNGTVSPNSDFGVAGGALGSRTVQLQARFSF